MLNSFVLELCFMLGLFFTLTSAEEWDWIEFVKYRKKMLSILENDKCELIPKLKNKKHRKHDEKYAGFYTHEGRFPYDDISELLYERRPGDYECEHSMKLLMMLPVDEMDFCLRGTWARCRPFTLDETTGCMSCKKQKVRWRCSVLYVRDHPDNPGQPAFEETQTWPVLDYCTKLSKERDNKWNAAHPNKAKLEKLMRLDDPNETINQVNPANPAIGPGWPDDDPLKVPPPPPWLKDALRAERQREKELLRSESINGQSGMPVLMAPTVYKRKRQRGSCISWFTRLFSRDKSKSSRSRNRNG